MVWAVIGSQENVTLANKVNGAWRWGKRGRKSSCLRQQNSEITQHCFLSTH